jgi:hypothetical protein
MMSVEDRAAMDRAQRVEHDKRRFALLAVSDADLEAWIGKHRYSVRDLFAHASVPWGMPLEMGQLWENACRAEPPPSASLLVQLARVALQREQAYLAALTEQRREDIREGYGVAKDAADVEAVGLNWSDGDANLAAHCDGLKAHEPMADERVIAAKRNREHEIKAARYDAAKKALLFAAPHSASCEQWAERHLTDMATMGGV